MIYFVPLNATISLYLTTVNGSRTPTQPDAAATYRIYGPSSATVVQNGSYSATEIDHTNAPWFFQATGLTVSAANGFAAGNCYQVRNTWNVSSTAFVESQVLVVY